VALSGGKAVVEFEYESLAEEVPAEAMPGYARQLDQASRWLGYELFY
jgi:hypothetical protein